MRSFAWSGFTPSGFFIKPVLLRGSTQSPGSNCATHRRKRKSLFPKLQQSLKPPDLVNSGNQCFHWSRFQNKKKADWLLRLTPWAVDADQYFMRELSFSLIWLHCIFNIHTTLTLFEGSVGLDIPCSPCKQLTLSLRIVSFL